MGSFLGASVASASPSAFIGSSPELNGLCGWSINSVIQGVDSCSRVNVCSQPCRRDGLRPAALCLPWSLNRLEVNGGPCAEVAGAWMEPPLTRRSHRGRTGPGSLWCLLVWGRAASVASLLLTLQRYVLRSFALCFLQTKGGSCQVYRQGVRRSATRGL